jgi:hypothetical protein
MGETNNVIAREIKEVAGLDVEDLMKIGLLHPTDAKMWLLKQKYYLMAKSGMSYTDIKYELSITYDVSVSTIEKMVYRKPRVRARWREMVSCEN